MMALDLELKLVCTMHIQSCKVSAIVLIQYRTLA